MKTGADVLVECLARWGVRRLFGMPGSHSTAIYDALARAGTIRTFLVRNEQAAAFAADGAARVTGRARRGLHHRRSRRDQRADRGRRVLGRLGADPAARRPGQLRCAGSRVRQLSRDRPRGDLPPGDPMVRHAPAGRPGPGDGGPGVPGDDLGASPAVGPVPAAGPDARPPAPRRRASRRSRRRPRRPCRSMRSPRPRPSWPMPSARSSWPAAARSGRARPEAIESLARRLGAPVITTLNAKGLIDERSPISLGHARSVQARAVLPHADVMLAVGCRFTEVLTDWRRLTVPDRLVQVDLDPDQIGMNHPVVAGIVADADAGMPRAVRSPPVVDDPRPHRLGPAAGRGPRRAAPEARMADRDAPLGPARRRAGVHRRLRDRLPDAGGLAVVCPARVLLPVELHHAGLGVPGGRRRGRGAGRPAGRLGERRRRLRHDRAGAGHRGAVSSSASSRSSTTTPPTARSRTSRTAPTRAVTSTPS